MFGCSAILVYNAVQPNKKGTNQANIHQIINQSWLSEWHACQSCKKNFGKTTFLWSASDRRQLRNEQHSWKDLTANI